MYGRALNAINYAFAGYGLTFDAAIDIIKEKDISKLTQEQMKDRQLLIKAVDNLIDFSIAEEYQTLSEMKKNAKDSDNSDEFRDLAIATFSKFNKQYSFIENGDILFAMGVAKEWQSFEENEIIEYRTQGDERVRASHEALDGLRYRKSEFPEALVPPIAHACRCYLWNTGSTDGRKLTNVHDLDEKLSLAVDPTFMNNVGESGKIFSEYHSYFDVKEKHVKELAKISLKIKKELGI